MNRRISVRSAVLASVAAIALGTTSTFAQTGPELLLKPWPKGQLVEARGDAMWLDSGHVRDGSDFQLGFYETEGRARVYPGQRADPRFGYNLTYIDVDAENGAVPNHLVDTSVAFGMGVLDNSGWLGGITVGVGYAAAGAFDDGNVHVELLLVQRSELHDRSGHHTVERRRPRPVREKPALQQRAV